MSDDEGDGDTPPPQPVRLDRLPFDEAKEI